MITTRTFAPDKLRKARRYRRWSQDKLSSVSDVSRLTISRLENGHQLPYPNTVKALAEALRIPVADLYDGEAEQ